MTSLQYLSSQLAAVDEHIASLRKERQLLNELILAVSSDHVVIEEKFLKNKKSRAKNVTYAKVVHLLLGTNRRLSTARIIKELRLYDQTLKDKTIRSHLRRLRLDRRLTFDVAKGVWGLPD